MTGCTDASKLHLCIKSTSTYAQDWCRCPFASRTFPSPKSPGDVYFYHRFLHRVNHRWVSASILPFLPPECRARQPNIAVNPSFSIHTATSPPNYGRLCVLHLKSNSCKISGGRRRGGREVVNCESKTINRVSRRSGAWCMDELLLLEQKHINWIACLSPGRHYTHRV